MIRQPEFGMPIVQYLIDQGADVNAKDDTGNTPLHRAAANGNNEAVKFLVSRGADVNAKSSNSGTPLHLAALLNSDVETVKFLVSMGADVNAAYADGTTPFDAAREAGNVAVVAYLHNVGAKSGK